jgi:hypothetical protein
MGQESESLKLSEHADLVTRGCVDSGSRAGVRRGSVNRKIFDVIKKISQLREPCNADAGSESVTRTRDDFNATARVRLSMILAIRSASLPTP